MAAHPMSDNSNTQFAMMAVWVSRRHGMPVEDVLTGVDSRFRKYQQEGGGWGYQISVLNPKSGALEFEANRQRARARAQAALSAVRFSLEGQAPLTLASSFVTDEKAEITTGCYVLLLMLAGAAGGGYVVKAQIIDPYLGREGSSMSIPAP